MNNSIYKYKEEITRVRRILHRIPEPGFKEAVTSKFIVEYLSSLGYKTTPTATTGVLCYIDRGRDSTVAYRSDMDGLPIPEESGVEFCSEHEGFMHACGHDGHMAILLVFAKYLSENDYDCEHNILLIFQPAEEGPGGAQVIIEEGVFEKYRVRKAFGLHVSPDYKIGEIASRPGEMFAAGTELYIDVIGKGAHAAQREKGHDALLAAAVLTERLVGMREEGSVITIGKLVSGTRKNVLAGKARLEGIMRSFNDDQMSRLREKAVHTASQVAAGHSVKIDVEVVPRYPVVKNDPGLFDLAKKRLGNRLLQCDMTMLSEDFSFYGKKCPAVFFLLGTYDGDEKHQYPLHSPFFDFDEESLLYGVEMFVDLL